MPDTGDEPKIAEERANSRQYLLRDIAKNEPLVICDSSIINIGDVMAELYTLKNYNQVNEAITKAVQCATGALGESIGLLREPNVGVIEEVSKEIRRGLEILGEKQRYLNTSTYRHGRHGSKDADLNVSEGKRLVDALCSSWNTLATECRRARMPSSEVCSAFKELIMYVEDAMKLKANKPKYGDMKGRKHEDFRTDEKLLGTALGKALEGQPNAIVTKDADFCYIMPVYVGLLMCPELEEPWLERRLREKPVTLYKAQYDSNKYSRSISTADLTPYPHFVAKSLSGRQNEVFKCGVKSHVLRIHRLLGQQTPAA